MKIFQNKKHFPVLFGIAMFIAIVVIMFIANSKALVKLELNPPIDGVAKLSTVGGRLVAVSSTNEMQVRDWNDITKNPLKILNQADKVALMADDKLLRIPSDKPDTIEIECIKKDCNSLKIPLGYGMRCNMLSVNRTGKTAGLVNVNISGKNSNNSYSKFSIAIITSNRLSEITTIENSSGSLELFDISISDDSRYIAIAGQKNNLGWLGVIDINKKQLLWEQSSDSSSKFVCAVFSPKSQMIYVGGAGRDVLVFDVATGKLANKWQMAETKVANKKQFTPTIAVSNDGRLVATATEPAGVIYLWDTQSSKLVKTLPVGHILITGIAFSPDGRYIAAGAVLMKNKIKICNVPRVR